MTAEHLRFAGSVRRRLGRYRWHVRTQPPGRRWRTAARGSARERPVAFAAFYAALDEAAPPEQNGDPR